MFAKMSLETTQNSVVCDFTDKPLASPLLSNQIKKLARNGIEPYIECRNDTSLPSGSSLTNIKSDFIINFIKNQVILKEKFENFKKVYKDKTKRNNADIIGKFSQRTGIGENRKSPTSESDYTIKNLQNTNEIFCDFTSKINKKVLSSHSQRPNTNLSLNLKCPMTDNTAPANTFALFARDGIYLQQSSTSETISQKNLNKTKNDKISQANLQNKSNLRKKQ